MDNMHLSAVPHIDSSRLNRLHGYNILCGPRYAKLFPSRSTSHACLVQAQPVARHSVCAEASALPAVAELSVAAASRSSSTSSDGAAASTTYSFSNTPSSSLPASPATCAIYGCPPLEPIEVDILNLQHKNKSTLTLLKVRESRIQSLTACCLSSEVPLPDPPVSAVDAAAAAAAAAADTVEALHDGIHSPTAAVYRRLAARNATLMALSRAKNVQIRALEAALEKAKVRLPRWRFDLTGGSSGQSGGRTSVEDSRVMVPTAALGEPALQATEDALKVHFSVKCVTSPGDTVWLVGDHPSLGSWNDTGALQLHWTSGHLWQADLQLHSNSSTDDIDDTTLLSFKAVLQRADGKHYWQSGPNREVLLGKAMDHHKEPCVASMDFYGFEDFLDLPLNYNDACLKACSKLLERGSCNSESAARAAVERQMEAVIHKLRQKLQSEPRQQQQMVVA